jgi:CubicO group peptidase (beta-lactamase class C family)
MRGRLREQRGLSGRGRRLRSGTALDRRHRPRRGDRYINSGLNVLDAILPDHIEQRGLQYHETLYGLLIDRLGMASYQHSVGIAGNLIASGAGFATLRDYAKLGVLYLQNGMWDGERLLPQGCADYALTPTHTGTSYAACFRTNIDRLFPDLPPDTAWASGA